MIEIGKLFYKYTKPLEEVDEPIPGETYFNVEGHALKYRGNDEYEFVGGSPLRPDFLITELTTKQLELFWKLVKNKYKRGINAR